MDVLSSFQRSVDEILGASHGLRILLLDERSIGMVSLAFGQSALYEKEIFLFDRIENGARSPLKFMQAVCILRNAPAVLRCLIAELRDPRYGSYRIYFTNAVDDLVLEQLAEADSRELVQDVAEIFCDYYPITSSLFSLNIPSCYGAKQSWDGIQLQRCLHGLVALCGSLGRRPTIRYDSNSLMTLELAQELQRVFLSEKDLFEFPRGDTTPILLLLDRRMDMMTPLLMPWTYQALVHELLGIENGRVRLHGALREADLSVDRDPFFGQHLDASFGELGVALKQSVDQLAGTRRAQTELASTEDVRDYFDILAQAKERSAVLERHAAILGHVNAVIASDHLLQTSEYEQYLACCDGPDRDFRGLAELLRTAGVADALKTKLLCMYALKYRGAAELPALLAIFRQQLADDAPLHTVARFTQFIAGFEFKYGESSLGSFLLSKAAETFGGFKSVDNIFSQHVPLAYYVLDQLVRGRLRDTVFPSVEPLPKERPQEVILFFVNGATYEEARMVAAYNKANPGCRVVVGGTTIHSTASVLADVAQRSA